MTEQAVVDKFLILKEEIKDFPSNRDEFWVSEAKHLIEKYIGSDTPQYDLIAGHTFYPNKSAINIETEQSQRDRGIQMINSCISHIKLHGIVNQRLGDLTDNLPHTNAITKQATKYHTGTWLVKMFNNDWIKLIVTGLVVIILGTYILVKSGIIK